MNSGQIKLLETRKFLREKEVSDIYGINRNTLRRQRWGDYGIPFQVKKKKKGTNRGGTILYLIDDIEAAMQKKIPTRKL